MYLGLGLDIMSDEPKKTDMISKKMYNIESKIINFDNDIMITESLINQIQAKLEIDYRRQKGETSWNVKTTKKSKEKSNLF